MQTAEKSSLLTRVAGHEKVRFVIVGGVNTVIDFSVLFLLVNLFDIPTLIANIISTTTALCFSYVLNKKAVFGNTDTHNTKQVVQFVVVTLVGLWVLQGVVITLLTPFLQSAVGKPLSLIAAKLVATLFSMTWNYLWYSRVVFRRQDISQK